MSARYFVFDTHGNCILQGGMNVVSSKFQGIPTSVYLILKFATHHQTRTRRNLPNFCANRASARETAWPITALPMSTVKYQFAHRNCSVGISFSILQRHSPFTPSESTKPPICHKVFNRQRFCHFLPEPTMLRRRTKDRANIFFQSHVELYDYVIRT